MNDGEMLSGCSEKRALSSAEAVAIPTSAHVERVGEIAVVGECETDESGGRERARDEHGEPGPRRGFGDRHAEDATSPA